MNVTYTVTVNVTNIVPTVVMSTQSINSDNKKVRYIINCYILHTFLLVPILLSIIIIICHHCIKYRSNQKHICTVLI